MILGDIVPVGVMIQSHKGLLFKYQVLPCPGAPGACWEKLRFLPNMTWKVDNIRNHERAEEANHIYSLCESMPSWDQLEHKSFYRVIDCIFISSDYLMFFYECVMCVKFVCYFFFPLCLFLSSYVCRSSCSGMIHPPLAPTPLLLLLHFSATVISNQTMRTWIFPMMPYSPSPRPPHGIVKVWNFKDLYCFIWLFVTFHML